MKLTLPRLYQDSIDEWFEAETRGLNDLAKIELKKRWGTLKQVLNSKSRLDKVVNDIFKDFRVKPRLKSGEGNAMLVASSVLEACKYYELFQAICRVNRLDDESKEYG